MFEMLLQKMVPCWFVPTLLKTSISVLAISSSTRKEKKKKIPDICVAANMLSKEAFCSACLHYLLAFSNIKLLLNI